MGIDMKKVFKALALCSALSLALGVSAAEGPDNFYKSERKK